MREEVYIWGKELSFWNLCKDPIPKFRRFDGNMFSDLSVIRLTGQRFETGVPYVQVCVVGSNSVVKS